ncbi:PTS sugar transporter subunit IIA [Chitinispirillales bacterium ANBcel5]|uniref:PTS sugar transporter subunit IIA n=1 Tax=Cellulosispirillum alkaliphilum TaxID=3039283 RepID=UPI002A4E7106|nr:PTS sugar transporter subunit IIA [Chitinispirillales bacterium ANBcel5]
MSYAKLFSTKRIVLLNSVSKEQMFRQLIELVLKDTRGFSFEQIWESVLERENLISTRISDTIAIPHARIPGFGGTIAAVGLSKRGIIYDSIEDRKIKLCILIVGDGNEHLEALSWTAQRLYDKERLESILKATSARRIFSLLTGKIEPAKTSAAKETPSSRLLQKAYALGEDLGLSGVIYHAPLPVNKLSFRPVRKLPLYIVCSDRSLFPQKIPGVKEIVQIPFKNTNRSSQVELVLIFLISQGVIKRNQKILSVLGSPEREHLDTIILTDVRDYRFFFTIGRKPRPKDLQQQVFARMLQIASELAHEGREGKPVGTLFVLGDSENVLKSCQQMVVNPFGGYKEENRNVLDPGLEATIKEFAKLDGAFIIRGDGMIIASGAFIKAESGSDFILKGLGARHTAGANISASTDALSIVLSESTRRVTVFKKGKQIMRF